MVHHPQHIDLLPHRHHQGRHMVLQAHIQPMVLRLRNHLGQHTGLQVRHQLMVHQLQHMDLLIRQDPHTDLQAHLQVTAHQLRIHQLIDRLAPIQATVHLHIDHQLHNHLDHLILPMVLHHL